MTNFIKLSNFCKLQRPPLQRQNFHSQSIYAPFHSHIGNHGWKSQNKLITNYLHTLSFIAGQQGTQSSPEAEQMIYLLGLWNLPWSLLHSSGSASRACVCVCVHACMRVAEVEEVVMLNKGLLSADTNGTKNSLTWKLKYKIYFQPECPLPIHIKWRSLVWANYDLNLLFSKSAHASTTTPTPANPISSKITWRTMQN